MIMETGKRRSPQAKGWRGTAGANFNQW